MIKQILKLLFKLLFKERPQTETSPLKTHFLKPKRKVNKVFIHCSGSDKEEDQSVERLDFLHTFNKKQIIKWGRYNTHCKGFKSIGYHYYIQKDGKINKCRSLEERPSSQKGHNTGSISICLAGEEEMKFTFEALNSLVELCKEIHIAYDKITFHGHCEVKKSKTCPNFNYRQLLGLYENGEMRD